MPKAHEEEEAKPPCDASEALWPASSAANWIGSPVSCLVCPRCPDSPGPAKTETLGRPAAP